MATGMLYLNDAEVEATYSLIVTEFSGWPGNLDSASRMVPLIEGPEMQGVLVDPRMIRRKASTATIKGIINATTAALGLTALDTLREVLAFGEVSVRTTFASDRECYAFCTDLSAVQQNPSVIDGKWIVSMSFTVKDGVAKRRQPDGYALTTSRTSCPVGTAESRPIITVHGGGASLTNPTITGRNAAGDSVWTMGFVTVIGATAALRVDCTRMSVSLITAGVITDALSLWQTGDFPVLRAFDSFASLGAYGTVELSSTGGTALGLISYTRAYV